jgi:hypothetical protein
MEKQADVEVGEEDELKTLTLKPNTCSSKSAFFGGKNRSILDFLTRKTNESSTQNNGHNTGNGNKNNNNNDDDNNVKFDGIDSDQEKKIVEANIREDLWLTYYLDKNRSGLCYICNVYIRYENYVPARISAGSENTLNNNRPICFDCQDKCREKESPLQEMREKFSSEQHVSNKHHQLMEIEWEGGDCVYVRPTY